VPIAFTSLLAHFLLIHCSTSGAFLTMTRSMSPSFEMFPQEQVLYRMSLR